MYVSFVITAIAEKQETVMGHFVCIALSYLTTRASSSAIVGGISVGTTSKVGGLKNFGLRPRRWLFSGFTSCKKFFTLKLLKYTTCVTASR